MKSGGSKINIFSYLIHGNVTFHLNLRGILLLILRHTLHKQANVNYYSINLELDKIVSIVLLGIQIQVWYDNLVHVYQMGKGQSIVQFLTYSQSQLWNWDSHKLQCTWFWRHLCIGMWFHSMEWHNAEHQKIPNVYCPNHKTTVAIRHRRLSN